MRRFLVTILLSVLASAGAAVAQTKSTTLTLDQARELALQNNISILQSANSIEAAEARVLSAKGQWLPSVSASGRWTRTQIDQAGQGSILVEGRLVDVPPVFSVNNYFSAGLSAGYTIFDGLARSNSVSSAVSRAQASNDAANRTRQSTVFLVEQGYLDVLRNRALVTVGEENLKRDERQLERIVESNRVGALSIADVYRQQSQVASDELALIQAQNTYETSKTNLVALIGLDPTVEYDFVDTSIRTEIDSVEIASTRERYKDIAALIARALQARPDYLAAQQEVSAAEDGVTVARSGYWPSVGAFASYGQGNEKFSGLSDNKTLNWGIGLNWNLFDQFRTNEALQSAQVSRRNAELSLAQAERDIGVEVKKALLDLDAAAKSVEVSRKAQVSAQEDYKIAEERYNLGAGTLLDRLVANASLVNAQVTRVNAIAGYLVTKFNLEYVIGERTY